MTLKDHVHSYYTHILPHTQGALYFVTQPYPAAVLALHMQYYRFHTCAVRTVISSLAPGTKERANSRIRSAIS